MEVGIFSHASNVAVRMTAAIGLSLVHPHLHMLISKMFAWLHTKERLSIKELLYLNSISILALTL